MPHALVLAGHGRYQDPWHDTAAVAHRLAVLLADDGIDTTVRATMPGSLDDVSADLLVVASGRGRPDADFDGSDDDWLPFHQRLAALVADGVPVLGLHQAANTFLDSPTWEALLGGRWVEGTTWHPPLAPSAFRVVDPTHPVTQGLSVVEAPDEQYLALDVSPDAHVLVVADHEGVAHPVVWVAPGPGRVLYDALGHDLRSYGSPSRVDLFRREVRWLLSR
ncbi:ThuA domain-containing protein [uncultured Cellulomonas sp.]|uniref:ThuA domain-containing protein n=1 Tax=uncultured Cellulomonas sp. TaxID=189682 RepID=UPI0028E3975B|nr:ThuA domain-containing protein [uncultured Cellulomonas sp.]